MNAHKDNTSPKIAAIHITGHSREPWTVEVLAASMKSALARFEEGMGRYPNDEESEMLWVAVQRYHGIPERMIEPPHLRQH